jgi:hypothetical protein
MVPVQARLLNRSYWQRRPATPNQSGVAFN